MRFIEKQKGHRADILGERLGLEVGSALRIFLLLLSLLLDPSHCDLVQLQRAQRERLRLSQWLLIHLHILLGDDIVRSKSEKQIQ